MNINDDKIMMCNAFKTDQAEAINIFIKNGVPLNAYVVSDGDLPTLTMNFRAIWHLDNTDIGDFLKTSFSEGAVNIQPIAIFLFNNLGSWNENH